MPKITKRAIRYVYIAKSLRKKNKLKLHYNFTFKLYFKKLKDQFLRIAKQTKRVAIYIELKTDNA